MIKAKIVTYKQWDAERAARGESAGERLPWVKDTDLVHACPRSGGHAIGVRPDGTCPKGCHNDK